MSYPLCALRQTHVLSLVCLMLLGCGATPGTSEGPSPRDGSHARGGNPGGRPNILVIVADDLGFTDLGSMGSEIETPNLDALRDRGQLYTDVTAAPYCAVSRSMLLTGQNNHVAGMGSQDLRTTHRGYEGRLTDRVTPAPLRMQEAGYHTFMTGKWHLGTAPEDGPHANGFDRSFVLLDGGANHYSASGIFFDVPISQYRAQGQAVPWPEGQHATDVYTDSLLSYIEAHRVSNAPDDMPPFFAYLAYTAPHWPLQVDTSYSNRYRGRYDDGYEVLRRQRFDALKAKGMVAPEAVLPPMHPAVKPWSTLTREERRASSRKMEIYAGMVTHMDAQIGRLMDALSEWGILDETVVFFMSDNGAAAEDFYDSDYFGPFLQRHYSDALADMGQPESFVSYGAAWAEAGTGPARYHKAIMTQGGVNVPMIVAGPPVDPNPNPIANWRTVLDLVPTWYEIAGIDVGPNEDRPLLGSSLFAPLGQQATLDSTRVFVMEHRGQAMVRRGHWKLLHEQAPLDPDAFALYNLQTDPGEMENVRDRYPEIFQSLRAIWDQTARDIGVQTPTPQPGSGPAFTLTERSLTVHEGGQPLRFTLADRGGDCEVPFPLDDERGGTDPIPPSQQIPVPACRIVVQTVTHAGMLVRLQATDHLIGFSGASYSALPEIQGAIARGSIKTLASEAALSLEEIILLRPDLVLVTAPPTGVHPWRARLSAVGIPVVPLAAYREGDPLDRAAWLEVVGALVDKREDAQQYLAGVRERYRALQRQAQADPIGHVPTVITGGPWRGVWHVAGRDTYVARLLRDAGAQYIYDDLASSETIPMGIEQVWPRALRADLWFHPGAMRSREAIVAQDTRLADLPAVQRGDVFNYDKQADASGRNPYWDWNALEPDVILADLRKVITGATDSMVYYRRLP